MESGAVIATDVVKLIDLARNRTTEGRNDLVSAMYVHVPDAEFDRVYAAIAAAVRPGGTLLVAGHHPAERETDLRNPRLSHLLFPPERVSAVLGDGWRVEVAEAGTREAEMHG